MSRDRDRILEQALKHELRAAGTQPDGACLDAETLGAWTDGSLDPAAMAAAEAHVSNCARCQAMAGTLLKSAGAVGTLGTPGTLGTLSLWKWWLAPIAAGVTAVTLWMVVPKQQELAIAPTQPEISKPAETPAAAQSLPQSAPARDAAVEPTDKLGQRDNKVAAAREDRPHQKPNEERKEEQAALQERAKLADTAAPAAVVVPAPAAAAAPATSPAAPMRAPAEFGALEKNARKIVAPPGVEVTDQSAPSASVCWFVGRAGLVVLTTDAGATFTRVDLADRLHITSVSATDALHATISTVDGRRFRTDDGGKLWRPF